MAMNTYQLKRLTLCSRPLIRSLDVQDAVSVDLEDDLDLRNTTRGRRDAGELELAEKVVVLGKSTFTLVDLDQDGGLVVGRGREAKIVLSVKYSGRVGN